MNKHTNYILGLSLFLGITLFTACGSNVLQEKYHNFPENKWYADSVIQFHFDITDTTKPYDLHYNIRHNLSYPYYNLYVQYSCHEEGGKENWIRKDGNLMNPKTGIPLGQGSSDLYNCRFEILKNHTFKKAGHYIFEIQQDMRSDTLNGVSAVGFRLELAE